MWPCLHRGSSESRDALRNIQRQGCSGCPTFRARTVYTDHVSCRELWEGGGTDRANYVPGIRDGERNSIKNRIKSSKTNAYLVNVIYRKITTLDELQSCAVILYNMMSV